MQLLASQAFVKMPFIRRTLSRRMKSLPFGTTQLRGHVNHPALHLQMATSRGRTWAMAFPRADS
jgi:hypothetical protein